MAYDSRIIKAEASFAEEVREILIATSDGRMVHDVQPLMRFGIRAIAEHDGRRESGRSGGGGRPPRRLAALTGAPHPDAPRRKAC